LAKTTCPYYFGIALENSNKGISFGKKHVSFIRLEGGRKTCLPAAEL